MSRWGNKQQQERDRINFEQLLQQKEDVISMLQSQRFMEEFKNNSSEFTQKIILNNYRGKLKQLIDIAFSPTRYSLSTNITLNNKLTYAAMEILTNLTEEFMDCIFEQNNENQDEVMQFSPIHPILQYMLKVLAQESPKQTSLGYLVKMMTPYVYHKADKMIQLMNGELNREFMRHFSNQSICELFLKSLEAQTESNFFEQLKLKLFVQMVSHIEKQQDQNQLLLLVQSFAWFLQGLVEKHEDKYQKSKYHSLLKSITQKSQCFQFLLILLDKYENNHALKTSSLRCLQIYLQIHLPVKQQQKVQTSQSSQVNKSFPLSQSFKQKLKTCIIAHPITSFISEIRLQLLIYYKLIKVFITIEPDMINAIITKQFITQTLKIMQNDQFNNILHNFQKDVLIEGIQTSPQVYALIKNQTQFDLLLKDNLTDKICRKSYESQLFLIGQSIKVKTEQLQDVFSTNWSDLEQTIKQKRQFYSVLIGGDPKNSNDQKWDNFESEVIEQKVQRIQVTQMNLLLGKPIFSCTPKLDELGGVQVLSQQGDDDVEQPVQAKNNHYFDSQLPLDSDKQQESLQKLQKSQQQIKLNPKLCQIKQEQQIHLLQSQTANLIQNPIIQSQQLVNSLQQINSIQNNQPIIFQTLPSDQQINNMSTKKFEVITSNMEKIPEVQVKSVLDMQMTKSFNYEQNGACQFEDTDDKLGFLKQDSCFDKESKEQIQDNKIVQIIQFVEFAPTTYQPVKEEMQILLMQKYGLLLKTNAE